MDRVNTRSHDRREVSRRAIVPACARTNDLCKCSIRYPCRLSFYLRPIARGGKEGNKGARGEIEGSWKRRGEKRGSSIPEPGLDPRPSPPKSSTAARPQFRFVFSALLLLPSFFLPLFCIFLFFIFFFFFSFISPPFSTFPTRPRRQPLDPFSFFFFFFVVVVFFYLLASLDEV